MERSRCAELERVVSQERRNLHERDLDGSQVMRENDELKADCERLKLRVQSLQSHIDSLQKYQGATGGQGLTDKNNF